jgi:hypothetical protein
VSKCIRTAALIKELKVSDPKLSLSMLFELAYAPDPKAAIRSVQSGETRSSKDIRKPSGAVPGGRYGAEGCLTIRERKDGKAISLRLNVDAERTPPCALEMAITQVEQILEKIKKMRSR